MPRKFVRAIKIDKTHKVKSMCQINQKHAKLNLN